MFHQLPSLVRVFVEHYSGVWQRSGFKRQGYIFALAMRWMTGGELAASA